MNALQNLQDKIGTLEVDRAKAETNLKSLAVETSEYKELLKQKHDQSSSSIGSHCSTRRDSHSEGGFVFILLSKRNVFLIIFIAAKNDGKI